MSSPIKRIVVKPGQILYIETPLGSIAIEPNRTDLKGRIYDHISLIPTNKLINGCKVKLHRGKAGKTHAGKERSK